METERNRENVSRWEEVVEDERSQLRSNLIVEGEPLHDVENVYYYYYYYY